MTLECPVISPTEERVSNAKAWPNLMKQVHQLNGSQFSPIKSNHILLYLSLPSPTAMILLLSESHAISVIRPLMGLISLFKICSSPTVSQMRTLPAASILIVVVKKGNQLVRPKSMPRLCQDPAYNAVIHTSRCNVIATWTVGGYGCLGSVASIGSSQGRVLSERG